MHLSGSRYKYLGYTFFLAVAIITALVAINQEYLFHAKTYEFGDMAANSLEVLQAKKFELYYGVYSRWGFHHPGPFLLYLYAWGETIFWEDLHLVPTPLDAQVLVVILITSSFLAAGIGAAARWVRSPMFIPLAVLVATVNFSSMYLDGSMLQTWTPYVMPMPFFCLIVAAATVAAGQGEDLPLLIFTGCFVIHIHIVQPLFFLPLLGVAYTGLWRACARAGKQEGKTNTPPWRTYPRAHGWAAAIIAVFVAPIVFDLCHGTESNVAAILHHIRTHRGEHHSYMEAVLYFLKFAAYHPPVMITSASPAEIFYYLNTHREMFCIWLGALLSPLLALALRRWPVKPKVESGAAAAAAVVRLTGRWRFVGCLAICLALTTLLTIFWAHIQDGEMFHYNAWFNHGIYFAYAFLGTIAVTDMLENLLARFPGMRWSSGLVALSCLALMLVTYGERTDRFKAHLSDNVGMRATASSVSTALAEHPDAPRIKFIDVPESGALGAAPAIAILLKRAGYEFRVRPEWKWNFGRENAIGDDYPASLIAAEKQLPMEMWRIVSASIVPDAAAKLPLVDNYVLEIGNSELDAAKEPVIHLVGSQYNGDKYCFSGFLPPDPGADHTLTVGNLAVIQFVPVPVPADSSVEIRLDFFSPLITAKHPSQRLVVNFNGSELATFTASFAEPAPQMYVLVPAKLWNAAQPLDFLTLSFPDAVAPKDIDDLNKDPRLIAFGARQISFRVVSPTQPASLP